MTETGEITGLIRAADRGDVAARNELFVLVQHDLKKIVHKHKRASGLMMDASTTAIVDDVFLRLVGQDGAAWRSGDRRKFFGFASIKIHDLLIDRMRGQQAARRGGRERHVEFAADALAAGAPLPGYTDLLHDLKDALERMDEFAQNDATLFRIRFFLDCTFEEKADIMGISKTEAVRSYQRTQLWLQLALKDYNLDA